ncbi:unnamed protein product [Auanema sp. JU1783]|nr:unnamed protein product [Auanema sp. JU1783]
MSLKHSSSCDFVIEGWLMVCDGQPNGMPLKKYGEWQPGYCISRSDDKSLICYRWEPDDIRYRPSQVRIRLDGSRSLFSNYWNVATKVAPKKPLSGYHTMSRCTLRTLREDDILQTDIPPSTSRTPFFTVRIRRNTTNDEVEPLDRRSGSSWATNRSLANSAHNLHMAQRGSSGSSTNLTLTPSSALLGENSLPDENSTTPQRLANFFARPFRTNPLKRTKSVSKLEKQPTVPGEPQHTLNRVDLPHIQRSQENLLSVGYGSRNYSSQSRDFLPSLRSSKSHESLLSFTTASHMIDLNENPRLHPVHPSVLSVPNCFRVANTYYACRTPAEQAKWIENLRRTMNPRQDLQRRVENCLQLWLLEAKGLAAKRRYFCEICLDKVLHARTTAKPRTDNVFWGEHFDFPMLPKYEQLCVNIYREADPKKKKDRSQLIGYVMIGIDQLTSRHPVERWYTVTTTGDTGNRLVHALGAKNTQMDQPAIRIKARWQSVEILPLRAYDDLLHFLTYNYLPLCAQLEPVLSVKAKEDFATTLVRILHRQKLAKDFLCDLIMSEVNMLDNDHLMFRGNSLATKAMEAYMKLVSQDYLQNTLGGLTQDLLAMSESCEVDPLKLASVSTPTLERNRGLLMDCVEKAWACILNSTSELPLELRDVFYTLRERLEAQGRGSLADTLISSSIFLRYLCPAILSPSLFSLCTEYPSSTTARNLTLIAKTLQNLANFTKFGGKEHYMEFMNQFVEREWQRMKDFLLFISSGPCDAPSRSDVHVDLGKELSLLTTYLEESWTPEVHEKASSDRRLLDLRAVVSNLKEHKRRSTGMASSPLTHQASSDYENSPQQTVLRPRNENVPAYRSTPPTGQATVVSRNRPAAHLMTSDDYVTSSALVATPSRHITRLSDETGTASSRTSDKTSSSCEARDTDSDSEIRAERLRIRKPKKRVDGSPDTGSLPPSSGYHSNNHSSSYSNSSASSSPVDHLGTLSLANAGYSPNSVTEMHPGTSGYGNSYNTSPFCGSSPAYEREENYTGYSNQMFGASSESEVSPRSSVPRTNPRMSRASALLRPTVIDVIPGDDWDRPNTVPRRDHPAPTTWNNNMFEKPPVISDQEKIIEDQRRVIERLILENEELKRHVAAVGKGDERSNGSHEDVFDSRTSSERTRKPVQSCQ